MFNTITIYYDEENGMHHTLTCEVSEESGAHRVIHSYIGVNEQTLAQMYDAAVHLVGLANVRVSKITSVESF